MSTITPDKVERWLTLKEAAQHLEDDYGLKTSWRYLEKLVAQGCPSSLNFGKRQVKMTQLLRWLSEQGIIER